MGCCLSQFERSQNLINSEELSCDPSQSKEFHDISLQLETDDKETNDWRKFRDALHGDNVGFLSTLILSDRKADVNKSGSIVDSFTVSHIHKDNK